jgi:hypothetical protein
MATLDEVTNRHTINVCEECGWNLTVAAEVLGVCVKTVYNILHRCEKAGLVRHEGKGGFRRRMTWVRVATST